MGREIPGRDPFSPWNWGPQPFSPNLCCFRELSGRRVVGAGAAGGKGPRWGGSWPGCALFGAAEDGAPGPSSPGTCQTLCMGLSLKMPGCRMLPVTSQRAHITPVLRTLRWLLPSAIGSAGFKALGCLVPTCLPGCTSARFTLRAWADLLPLGEAAASLPFGGRFGGLSSHWSDLLQEVSLPPPLHQPLEALKGTVLGGRAWGLVQMLHFYCEFLYL